MRIHEGEYAYDLELQRDPATQLVLNWRFIVYRLRPVEVAVGRGEGATREEAEAQARKLIRKLAKEDSPGRAA
jgi:hypothetical protein